MSLSFSPTFSSKSFIVPDLTLKCLIHSLLLLTEEKKITLLSSRALNPKCRSAFKTIKGYTNARWYILCIMLWKVASAPPFAKLGGPFSVLIHPDLFVILNALQPPPYLLFGLHETELLCFSSTSGHSIIPLSLLLSPPSIEILFSKNLPFSFLILDHFLSHLFKLKDFFCASLL